MPFICLVTGTNSSILFKLVGPISNLKLKQIVSISATMKCFAIFIDAHTRSEVVQIRDPEMKILNFDDITLKLLAQKQAFQKFRVCGLWLIKIELRNQDKW